MVYSDNNKKYANKWKDSLNLIRFPLFLGPKIVSFFKSLIKIIYIKFFTQYSYVYLHINKSNKVGIN